MVLNDISGQPPPAPVDASSSISLQFGSISPGLVTGMQIPAQTSSSAPPNLDGQKKDKACYDSLKAAPAVPTIKDTREPNTGEVRPVPKSKRDVQVSTAPPAPQTQKPSVHLQSHHSQFPVQFCVPNLQTQSQGTPNPSLPIPIQTGMSIPLPMGNPPIFVAGLQPPHVMQSQGLIHQGQNFNYSSQIGSRIPSHLGSMGINMTPQFPPQQAAKFMPSRKSVKITHPETHEELRFDGSFPPNHLMSYYSNSYNSSSLFFPHSSSVALNSAQILPSSQPLRFSNQVCTQKCIENNSVGLASPQPSGVKEKVMLEPNVAKSTTPSRKKKKKKALYRKTESAGTSSDLYVAYKGPEEKIETNAPAQSTEKTLSNTTDVTWEWDIAMSSLKTGQSKVAPGDWEDAADISTPNLPNVTWDTAKSSLKTGQSKVAPGDLEDAADISTPNLPNVTWDTAMSSLKTGHTKVAPGDWEDAVDISTPNLPNVAKSTMPSQKKKKKKKELYRKAKAADTQDTAISSLKTGQSKVEPEDWEDVVDISTPNLPNVAKSTMPSLLKKKKKKKMKELYRKAEAAGTRDTAISSLKTGQSKVELEDWEDALDFSIPNLTMKNEQQVNDHDGDGLMTKKYKKYSRDYLLRFAKQFTNLPEVFEIPSSMAGAFMVSRINISHESYLSPGKKIDMPIGGSRPDNCGIVMGDKDKWSKLPGPLMLGKVDKQMDIGYGGNVGFQPGQGGNNGVLANPRAQTPIQHAGRILAGPVQSLGPLGVLRRYNRRYNRWQHGTAFQKGLLPTPQTPLQEMYKAQKKYERGKVSDEEEIKQRHLKAILNKLTQNIEKQVKEVNIDIVVTLSGVISQIFDEALMEPTFCEMYANFCFNLAAELPDVIVENEIITFKRLLRNKCKEEFERGEREEEEANKVDEEGETKQSEEEREEKRLQAQRRMLGIIRLMGELCKKRMVRKRIMHKCIKKLLGQYQNPDEENIEALCKLMSTTGERIDCPKAKKHMDAYFEIMAQLSNNVKLSSRVRLMLRETIDLRKNKWQTEEES